MNEHKPQKFDVTGGRVHKVVGLTHQSKALLIVAVLAGACIQGTKMSGRQLTELFGGTDARPARN